MMIKKKADRKEEARIKARQKERESRRKKMLRTKYGQKPLKHAKKGVLSCLMAALVLFILLAMIILSFMSKGDIGLLVGVVGLMTIILSGIGFNTGIKGFKERDKNYITCKVGAILNGLALIGLAAMFIRGLI